jgi:hypothetical protein
MCCSGNNLPAIDLTTQLEIPPVAGRAYQTAGIIALPPKDQSAIREKVETFDVFTSDNDPHGERNLGAFEHNGQRIFWKIDYCDCTMTKGSEDPGDPRVLHMSGSKSIHVPAWEKPRLVSAFGPYRLVAPRTLILMMFCIFVLQDAYEPYRGVVRIVGVSTG